MNNKTISLKKIIVIFTTIYISLGITFSLFHMKIIIYNFKYSIKFLNIFLKNVLTSPDHFE